jgi:lipopolysaccharide transport system ATP-binding protein
MISIKNLNKSFWIPHERHRSLRSRILSAFKKSSSTELHVLKDINIEIGEGECVGIIGHNGCGKSTLLKIIAGIIMPDTGDVLVKGEISPFLELGVGFNHELTVYDNIYLYGAVLGLTGEEIEDKFDSIIAFSGLENFVDAKLKTLSSGMQVRAAFAVASAVDRAIYLADEVLAVGDISFQEKCLNVYRDMQADGKTIIFVSHSIESIIEFCSRAIWINNGVVAAIGETKEVIAQYLDFMKVPQVPSALPELKIDSVIMDAQKERAQIGYRIISGLDGKVIVQGTEEVSL